MIDWEVMWTLSRHTCECSLDDPCDPDHYDYRFVTAEEGMNPPDGWYSHANVVGTGVGTDGQEYGIQVTLTHPVITDAVDGYLGPVFREMQHALAEKGVTP